MARPLAPAPLPGLCHLCGYRDHPADLCAVHPCHRCSHHTTTRNDGTTGYQVEDYETCPCKCHRPWRAAWAALLQSGAPARYVPDEPPRGRHSPTEDDFA